MLVTAQEIVLALGTFQEIKNQNRQMLSPRHSASFLDGYTKIERCRNFHLSSSHNLQKQRTLFREEAKLLDYIPPLEEQTRPKHEKSKNWGL